MKQNFSEKSHEKFKQLFDIKNKAGEYDEIYLEKTIKYINYIKFLPGLRMIGVGNSISMNSGKESSDIDLYIVASQNRLWCVRIFITIIFTILLVRKTRKKHAGRFCLSFFSTEDGMDFYKFALENDPYLFFWTLYFKPILSYNNTYNKFIEINSKIFNLENYKEIIKENKKCIKYEKQVKTNKSGLGNFVLDILEKILKKIFLTKTKNSFQKLGKPFGVVITDELLKFHDRDIRKDISKKIKD